MGRVKAKSVKTQWFDDMSNKSQEIHDMIRTFELAGHPERMASRILDILDAMNRRMDEIEAGHKRTADVASCLANGIQPD